MTQGKKRLIADGLAPGIIARSGEYAAELTAKYQQKANEAEDWKELHNQNAEIRRIMKKQSKGTLLG